MEDIITMKTSWESITYDEFEQLNQIIVADIPDHYKTTHLISVLSGLDIDKIEELPITTFKMLGASLSFMNTKVPDDVKHKNEYEVNGRKYILQADIDKICTAQFLDYTTYSKEEERSIKKLTSCFLIPEGHKYGDGYDIKQVLYDIGCMSFLDINALAFFLRLQYAAYILISTDSIERMMKKMKVPKRDRIKSITQLRNMARSLLSSNSSNSLV